MEFLQNNKFLKIFIAVLIIFFILFCLLITYLFLQNQKLKSQIKVTNFEECSLVKDAKIQQSYPAICVIPSGESFVQELSDEEKSQLVPPEDNSQIGNDEEDFSNTPVSKNGCIVGGCSGEICQDKDEEPMASTCLYKEEYDCYKKAVCERQSDGKCGWTQTDELKTCLLIK